MIPTKTPKSEMITMPGSEISQQDILEENIMLKSQIVELQNVIVSMCVINQR